MDTMRSAGKRGLVLAPVAALLLSVAEYITMVGGLDAARPCLQQLDGQGRIVEHLGAQHISFPMWTRIEP